jgi:hypothetical protein
MRATYRCSASGARMVSLPRLRIAHRRKTRASSATWGVPPNHVEGRSRLDLKLQIAFADNPTGWSSFPGPCTTFPLSSFLSASVARSRSPCSEHATRFSACRMSTNQSCSSVALSGPVNAGWELLRISADSHSKHVIQLKSRGWCRSRFGEAVVAGREPDLGRLAQIGGLLWRADHSGELADGKPVRNPQLLHTQTHTFQTIGESGVGLVPRISFHFNTGSPEWRDGLV